MGFRGLYLRPRRAGRSGGGGWIEESRRVQEIAEKAISKRAFHFGQSRVQTPVKGTEFLFVGGVSQGAGPDPGNGIHGLNDLENGDFRAMSV